MPLRPSTLPSASPALDSGLHCLLSRPGLRHRALCAIMTAFAPRCKPFRFHLVNSFARRASESRHSRSQMEKMCIEVCLHLLCVRSCISVSTSALTCFRAYVGTDPVTHRQTPHTTECMLYRVLKSGLQAVSCGQQWSDSHSSPQYTNKP